MRDLLRDVPVEMASVRPRDDLSVQLDLERDVVGEVVDSQIRRWSRVLIHADNRRQLVERRDPRRDRRRKRLPQERSERHVLEGLDVARAPVVDEHRAEDVLQRALYRNRLAEARRLADHEAELELEVELLRRAEVVGLALTAWPPDLRAADDDRARAAVVADWEPAPVRRQRLLVGPEHPPHVRRVLERRVEVDVVRDRKRQLPLHLGNRYFLSLFRDQVPRQDRIARAQVDHDIALEAPDMPCDTLSLGENADLHRIPSAFSSPTGSSNEQEPIDANRSRRTQAHSSASAVRPPARKNSASSAISRVVSISSSSPKTHAASRFRKPCSPFVGSA